MLGLDEQFCRTGAPVEDEADQIAQREHTLRLFVGAEVHVAQLVQRQLTDQAGGIGGAVDGAVVHADQVTVAGEPDVAFDTVGALLQR